MTYGKNTKSMPLCTSLQRVALELLLLSESMPVLPVSLTMIFEPFVILSSNRIKLASKSENTKYNNVKALMLYNVNTLY